MKRFWNKKNIMLVIGFALLVALPFLIISEKHLPMLTDNTINPYPEPKDICRLLHPKSVRKLFLPGIFPGGGQLSQGHSPFTKNARIFITSPPLIIRWPTYMSGPGNRKKRKNIICSPPSIMLRLQTFGSRPTPSRKLADLHTKLEHFKEAEKRYSESLDLLKNGEPNRVLGSIHEGMGHMYWKANRIPKAIDSFTHARDTFAALHYTLGVNT